jgi:hypothetical protein
MKRLFIIFFDMKCIAHSELIPQGQTVNQTYYMEILKLNVERGLNFGPMIGFSTVTPAHKALSFK